MNKKYKIWECKIIVSDEIDLPDGFDFPPRSAAIKVIENAGFEVISCFSGWGSKLNRSERNCLKKPYDE